MLRPSIISSGEVRPVARALLSPPQPQYSPQLPPLRSVKLLDQVRERIRYLHRFFGMPFAGRRFTHCVSIDTKGLDVVFGRQRVFVVKNSVPPDISKRLVANGEN